MDANISTNPETIPETILSVPLWNQLKNLPRELVLVLLKAVRHELKISETK